MEPTEPAPNRAADQPRYVRIGLALTDRRLTQYVLKSWFRFDELASPPRDDPGPLPFNLTALPALDSRSVNTQ